MFTIGEFSKICQVSVKTLHHYDKIHLLAPAKVDACTGYRYYTPDQLPQMLLIQRLKRYGFSLDEIRSFLLAPDEHICFSKLKEQQEKLRDQKHRTALIINELSTHLQNFERTGDIMGYQKNYEIRTVNAPAKSVISLRKAMGIEEFGNYYSRLYERIAREKLTPDGLVGAVYYDDEFNQDSSDIELIVGIRETDRADKILPGTLCAMTVHHGSYSSLPDAYAALVSWMEENGYEWDGAPYDIYTKSHMNQLPPEEWETEVYFPLQ